MASPAFRASSSLPEYTLLSPTVSTIINPSNPSYILHIAPLPVHSGYVVTSSSPAHRIVILDANTIREKRGWDAHDGKGITGLKVMDGRHVLSCGMDGTVSQWDERLPPKATLKMRAPNGYGVLGFDIASDGWTCAGGTDLHGEDAHIVFWDVRSPDQPIRKHSSTHSDDVTSVTFVPAAEPLLLSTSSDGLISLSNPREDDEDEAVITASNWGASIARAGIAGTNRIWAASDMETFSLWSADLDLVKDLGDIRLPRASLAYTPTRGERRGVREEWKIDYHIDGLWSGNEMRIVGGTNGGDIGVTSVEKSDSWELGALLRGGHEGVVRSILFDDEHGLCISGGEDAQRWTELALPNDVV
ncbi:WD40 repeat-like protein [Sistotremastrum niveocremeum HHB9708]|uniref:WD40 repeat-like protein n=1 Tax=Sistotremastrum niveocremeum HHB9708 TaxID=1314777 RepID=A0A164ZPU1_9AGAM|nr:WD40 repeat-like protein [Sistotremastrum niveocremeum HHB9708]